MEGHDIVVYTDGSHSNGRSGLGIALCHSGVVELTSLSWDGLSGSTEAEFLAAAEGLERALSLVGPGARALLVVDFVEVARFAREGVAGPRNGAATAWLEPVLETARLSGITVDALAVKGHGLGMEDYTAHEVYMNGVADGLARMGRQGSEIRMMVEDDSSLRERIRSADPRLCPEDGYWLLRTCTAEDACRIIGVGRNVIDRLVRHGYLHVVPEVSRLTTRSVEKVAMEAARLRAESGLSFAVEAQESATFAA